MGRSYDEILAQWEAFKSFTSKAEFQQGLVDEDERRIFSQILNPPKVPRGQNANMRVPMSVLKNATKTLKNKKNYLAELPEAKRAALFSFLSESPKFAPFATQMKKLFTIAATPPAPGPVPNRGAVPMPAPAPVRMPAPVPIARIEGFCPLINIRQNCYQNASMQVLHSVAELNAFLSQDRTAEINAVEAENAPILERLRIADEEDQAASAALNANEFDLNLLQTRNQKVYQALQVRASLPCTEYNSTVPKILHLLNIFFREYARVAQTGGVLDMRTILRINYPQIQDNLYTDILRLLQFTPGKQEDAGEYIRKLLTPLGCSALTREIGNLFKFNVVRFRFCENEAAFRGKDRPHTLEVSSVQPLSIKDAGVVSVETALQDLQSRKPDVIDGVVACGCGRQTHIQMKLQSLPSQKYLFLELERIVSDLDQHGNPQIGMVAGEEQILKKKIDKNIVLTPRITIGDTLFQLKMAVHHGGGAYGGHYISFSFNADGSPNICFDDSSIRQATAADAASLLKNATVLLYEKVPVAGGKRRLKDTRKRRKTGKRHTRKD